MNKKNNSPIVYLICGFIGAGKTTYAKKLELETGAVRFTKDEWLVTLFGNRPPQDRFAEYDQRMTELATDMALKCAAAGLDVIIDDCFWYQAQREEIRQRVAEIGAEARLIYLDQPVEVMRARTLERSQHPPDDSFEITLAEFEHYWPLFEPPAEGEAFTTT